jgi:hypothetical protein
MMCLQIIQGTPVGIRALFAGLVALGLRQTKARIVGTRRADLLSGVFAVLSLAGVLVAFGGSALAVAAWGLGIAAAVAAGPRPLPRLRVSWQAAGDTLQIGGSWLPLALIMALFFVKYAAGVSMAMHPGLARETDFIVACGFAYGFFSGLFAARGLQLWQVRRAASA